MDGQSAGDDTPHRRALEVSDELADDQQYDDQAGQMESFGDGVDTVATSGSLLQHVTLTLMPHAAAGDGPFVCDQHP